MNKIISTLVSFFTLATIFPYAQDKEIEYIQKYASIAVAEMELYKVPASITLAQGILETGSGQSLLAQEANNHFGIKCKKNWEGETMFHTDDAKGECFRKYNAAKDSYRDHSKFLAERPYYKNLFKLEITDYKGWAHGLKKAGYATNPRYAYILISKIEKLDLNKFDNISSDQVDTLLEKLYGPTPENIKEEKAPTYSPTKYQSPQKEYTENKEKQEYQYQIKNKTQGRINNLDYIVVLPKETIFQISEKHNIPVEKLLEYNELKSPRDLKEGQFLFFKRKKNWADIKYHTVQNGENMYLISQLHGIKLDRLYYKNRMEKGQEPKVGEILYLRDRKPKKQ